MTKALQIERLSFLVVLVVLVMMCAKTVLAKEKRNKIAQIAMDEADVAFEAEKYPRGRSRTGWGSCSFGKCGRRRNRGKKRFEQVRAQFASDAEDFHNNYAVNLDSSSHKKNRNNENERRLENS